ncbi:MAG: M23 family metallopeptidase [Gammaproteobacteria bacterium]|nr:M23 family metallopeptidase [Gammaproteobacteria bacterium]
MRYISLSRNVQLGMCLLVLMMVGWAGASWIKMQPYTQVVASYREALSAKEALLAQLSAERESARTYAQNLNSEISTLHVQLSGALNQVAEIKDAQFTLMAQLQERTKGNADRLEQAIKLTGLNLNTLGGKTNTGVGGPFVAAGTPVAKTGNPFTDMNDMFEDSVVKLETQMNRWASLEGLFEHLPVVAPLNTGHLSSRFGKRQDPFTNRWAMHSGIDLSAPLNTPVYSTAPGKITFAGRDGPYGYMVEIDHGLGLTTRHGHLNKLLVKSGEQVDLHHKIGLVGSSGRSTGPHLHYEVMFQGEPHDPARFLEAGKYVFQK